MRKLYFFSLLFLSISAFAKNKPTSCSAEFSFQTSGNTLWLYPMSGTDSAYTHYWNFGDLNTSTDVQPVHTYSQCGNYTVYHEIVQHGANGEIVCMDSVIMTITIVCNNDCIANAGFTVQGGNANPANYVFINNTTISNSAAAVSCLWYFGDGTTSNTNSLTNVEHNYTTNGIYDACLYVIAEVPGTNIVCRDTFCTSIQVNNSDTSNPCQAVASFVAHSSPSNPNIYEFVNTSTVSSGIATYFWNFGDGTLSHEVNPVYNFTIPGTHNICLTVMSSSGCTDTFCSQITIASDSNSCNLRPDFEYSVNPNLSVHFSFGGANNLPDSNAIITWNFGDNSSATGYSVSHEYTLAGTYLVCVSETLSNGCTKDTCKEIQVESANPNPCNLIPYISYHGNSANPNEYEFIGMPNSLDSGMVIYWIFSDSSMANGHSVVHVFDQPGIYTACMNVVYNGNCAMDTCVTITVASPGSNSGVVTVYPNPAENLVSVNLELSASETINASIYNMQNLLMAQYVYSGNAGSNLLSFDISTLPAGLYTIRFYYGGMVRVARFQKL